MSVLESDLPVMPMRIHKTPAYQPLILCLLGLCLALPGFTGPQAGEEIWLQIDTQELILRVMKGTQVIEEIEDISIGRFGASTDKRRQDGKTPLGEFRISRINNASSFHRFFGFDYPTLEQAERALAAGDLALSDFLAIRNAHRGRRAPPQNTALGGHLGIHGIGTGDPEVHASYNWTNGCIALTNRQIDRLAEWIRLGTRVVVY